ncbi:hypothetical protein CC80DRAFT_599660 [Byssothecium circinans]|uniref:C3H1-type domain-containing protein n=1 Tax=Byssothecium circinans TaxID=147558 RepID=A0A6A5T9L9_9PLEO|nr:hypothetical protein CC80DRAFT_599660 [Byssothecium circinans]
MNTFYDTNFSLNLDYPIHTGGRIDMDFFYDPNFSFDMDYPSQMGGGGINMNNFYDTNVFFNINDPGQAAGDMNMNGPSQAAGGMNMNGSHNAYGGFALGNSHYTSGAPMLNIPNQMDGSMYMNNPRSTSDSLPLKRPHDANDAPMLNSPDPADGGLRPRRPRHSYGAPMNSRPSGGRPRHPYRRSRGAQTMSPMLFQPNVFTGIPLAYNGIPPMPLDYEGIPPAPAWSGQPHPTTLPGPQYGNMGMMGPPSSHPQMQQPLSMAFPEVEGNGTVRVPEYASFAGIEFPHAPDNLALQDLHQPTEQRATPSVKPPGSQSKAGKDTDPFTGIACLRCHLNWWNDSCDGGQTCQNCTAQGSDCVRPACDKFAAKECARKPRCNRVHAEDGYERTAAFQKDLKRYGRRNDPHDQPSRYKYRHQLVNEGVGTTAT